MDCFNGYFLECNRMDSKRDKNYTSKIATLNNNDVIVQTNKLKSDLNKRNAIPAYVSIIDNIS